MFEKPSENLATRITNEGVVTHYGSDLDQVMALEALRRWVGQDFKVDRTPAGKPIPGRINVDVGDAQATDGITMLDNGTVIIDHHFNRYANTLEVLVKELGLDIPAQAVEIADTCDKASALDYRSGVALVRYLAPSQAWELADAGLLTACLTDEQIARFGLAEAVEQQKDIVETAVAAVKKFAVNDETVVTDRMVLGGSFVAYEMGYKFYASVTPHESGGITFAINAKPGMSLPEPILNWAKDLQKEFGPGVFIRADGAMVVAGGPKNPDFRVPIGPRQPKAILEHHTGTQYIICPACGHEFLVSGQPRHCPCCKEW